MKDLIARIEDLAITNHNLNNSYNDSMGRETDYLKKIDELKESLKTMIWIARDYEKERDEYIEKYGELEEIRDKLYDELQMAINKARYLEFKLKLETIKNDN